MIFSSSKNCLIKDNVLNLYYRSQPTLHYIYIHVYASMVIWDVHRIYAMFTNMNYQRVPLGCAFSFMYFFVVVT